MKNNKCNFPPPFAMEQIDLVSDRHSHPQIKKLIMDIKTQVNIFDDIGKINHFARNAEMVAWIREMEYKQDNIKKAIDKSLKDIAKLCREEKLPLFVSIVYDYFTYQVTNTIAPAYIMYSLKRKTLVVIDKTLEEWTDPEAFLADFEEGYLEKGFYVDPELGVGKVSCNGNIVKIGNFGTLYDTPDTVWEYVTHLQNLLNVNRIAINTEKV